MSTTESNDQTLVVLARVKRLLDEVVYEKFNWGESALDANAIQLLNEVPGELYREIDRLEHLPTTKEK